MYRLKKGENEIALANQMNYIRLQENGVWALCGKMEADGVVADGTVYRLGEEIDNVETFDGVERMEILDIILGGDA